MYFSGLEWVLLNNYLDLDAGICWIHIYTVISMCMPVLFCVLLNVHLIIKKVFSHTKICY